MGHAFFTATSRTARIVVDFITGLLVKSFCDEPCFVPVYGTIRQIFNSENTFTTNNILMRFWWNQLIGAVSDDRIDLSKHSSAPARVTKCLCNGGGYFWFGLSCSSGEGEFGF